MTEARRRQEDTAGLLAQIESVYGVLHGLSRLELHRVTGWDVNRALGLRVTSHASLAMLARERSESDEHDLLTTDEGSLNSASHGLQCSFSLDLLESSLRCDVSNEFCFGY